MPLPRVYSFRGRVPASKSILNRLLLIASHATGGALRISGDSRCEDVRNMRAALEALARPGDPVPCGEAGLVLRLIAATASRVPGKHLLKGSARLLQRPQKPLIEALASLEVSARPSESGDALVIETQGWKEPARPILLDRSISSQFASALLLNAWELEFPLEIEWRGKAVSEGYFDLSLKLAREAGMEIHETPDGFLVPPGQRVRATAMEAETDLSSAFAIAALGAIGGYAEIRDYPQGSAQPDRVFPSLLARMGAEIDLRDRVLIVHKPERLKPIEVDLRDSPDLFPVLATLCAFAEGRSVLRGAPHLAHKESDRLRTTTGLIRLAGRDCDPIDGGLVIHGKGPEASRSDAAPVPFDPERDHRLVFAAAIAIQAGVHLRVTDISPVDKSFPEFREEFRKVRPA